MRTLPFRFLPKRNLSKWSKLETSLLHRILSFLFRDLVPSLIMLIIFGIGALFVAEKINQAKQAHTVNIVDKGSHQ